MRQLDAVAARFVAGLAHAGPLIAAAEDVANFDIDDTMRATFGYAKQGAGYCYRGVKRLNALLATVSTATSAPVIVATRLRKGYASPTRGGARLVADSLRTTACGVTGTVVLRADSAYYRGDVIAAASRQGTRFSITARKRHPRTGRLPHRSDDPGHRVDADHHPRTVFDEHFQCTFSKAEVAETPYTASTSRPKGERITARLIVRRARDQNPDHKVPDAQGELFPARRQHAVFANADRSTLTAEADHRRHAIIERVIGIAPGSPNQHDKPDCDCPRKRPWATARQRAFTAALGPPATS